MVQGSTRIRSFYWTFLQPAALDVPGTPRCSSTSCGSPRNIYWWKVPTEVVSWDKAQRSESPKFGLRWAKQTWNLKRPLEDNSPINGGSMQAQTKNVRPQHLNNFLKGSWCVYFMTEESFSLYWDDYSEIGFLPGENFGSRGHGRKVECGSAGPSSAKWLPACTHTPECQHMFQASFLFGRCCLELGVVFGGRGDV